MKQRLFLAVLLFAVGCGSPSSTPAPASDSKPQAPATTTAAAPQFQAATEGQAKHIAEFLKPGLSLAHAHIAKSQAHANATFFAAQVVGAPPSGETPVGVWLVSGPEDFSGGLTLAVDAYAKVYSVAPDGTKSKAEVSIADPPAGDLQRFVAGQVK